MALSRRMFHFIFLLFFILSQLTPGCQAGLDYSQPLAGGDFAVCENCRLGRGKCRPKCLKNEKVDGDCKLNLVCCRRRV